MKIEYIVPYRLKRDSFIRGQETQAFQKSFAVQKEAEKFQRKLFRMMDKQKMTKEGLKISGEEEKFLIELVEAKEINQYWLWHLSYAKRIEKRMTEFLKKPEMKRKKK